MWVCSLHEVWVHCFSDQAAASHRRVSRQARMGLSASQPVVGNSPDLRFPHVRILQHIRENRVEASSPESCGLGCRGCR